MGVSRSGDFLLVKTRKNPVKKTRQGVVIEARSRFTESNVLNS